MSSQLYPLPKFRFKVTFHGLFLALLGGDALKLSEETSFKEVSGLKMSVGTEDVTSVLGHTKALPTWPKYSDLVLKRGIVTSSGVQNWIKNAVDYGQVVPLDLTICLLNADDQPAMTWQVSNAWPISWEVDALNSTANEVLTETLTLSYQSFSVS